MNNKKTKLLFPITVVAVLFLAFTFLLLESRTVYANEIIDSGTCGSNLTWELNDEGVLTISGSGEMSTYTDGNSPWYQSREAIESIRIGNSVTSIGGYAFSGCNSLTNIDISDSVTLISTGAFSGCTKLDNIVIPNSVTRIGGSAFTGCSGLTSMSLPFVGATSDASSNAALFGTIFGNSSYPGGTKTTQFYSETRYSISYIPTGLKRVEVKGGNIKFGAFYGCGNLEEIILSDEITGIGADGFRNCSSLMRVNIPANAKSIGANAFHYCPLLTSIVIPEGVVSIGEEAFESCYKLTSITVPDSVKSIGKNAFYKNGSLQVTVYTVPNSYVSTNIPSKYKVVYLCDAVDEAQIPDSSYMGFSTNTVVMKSGSIMPLHNYFVSSYSLDECEVFLSDSNNFVYDDGSLANIESGECTVTVIKDNKSATVRVVAQNEDASDLESISFSNDKITLTKGEATVLTAVMSPSNADCSRIAWTSSNTSVVSVDKGCVTAIGGGTSIVRAYSTIDNEIQAECEITVPVSLHNIILLEDNLLLEKGESNRVKTYKYPSDATDADITYSSSDSNVATVDEKGNVTAVGFGLSDITISSKDITRTVSVRVYNPLKGLSLDKDTAQVHINNTVQLQAVFEPEDTTERDVIWSSSKESVATVDNNGLVTARGVGIATITATAGNYSASCNIVCPRVALTNIELPSTAEIIYGETYTNEVIYTPENTTDNKKPVWTSSDDNVFTVSEDGVVTTTGIGTAYLTATVGELSTSTLINIIKGDPQYVLPEGIVASCEQKLSQIPLPSGFVWDDGTLSVGNAGTKQFNAVFTPEDTDHYNTIIDIKISVTIEHNYDDEWSTNGEKHWHECVCGEHDQEENHAYSGWKRTKDPSCIEEGNEVVQCDICGYEKDRRSVPATNHDWDSTATIDIVPTCLENGAQSIHCKKCDATKDDEEIPAIGHNWNKPTYIWSKDNKVVTATRTCDNDKNHKETETATVTTKVTRRASYTAKGQTTYTATFKNSAFATQTKTLTNIAQLPKKTNTITVKVKKPTVKFTKLKKKAQTVAVKKAFAITKAQGKVTYKKISGNKRITINSAGKITLKRGLKKGTYKLKVKVTAAGNTTYKAGAKTVTLAIKVK